MHLFSVNFPVKNLELKDYIPLPAPKENEKLRSKYDLIANIVHDGKPGEGSYRVFVQRKSEELWLVTQLISKEKRCKYYMITFGKEKREWLILLLDNLMLLIDAGMRCKTYMFLKLFPKWLHFLRLICRYMSSISSDETDK